VDQIEIIRALNHLVKCLEIKIKAVLASITSKNLMMIKLKRKQEEDRQI